jgi:hypothetical protein
MGRAKKKRRIGTGRLKGGATFRYVRKPLPPKPERRSGAKRKPA